MPLPKSKAFIRPVDLSNAAMPHLWDLTKSDSYPKIVYTVEDNTNMGPPTGDLP